MRLRWLAMLATTLVLALAAGCRADQPQTENAMTSHRLRWPLGLALTALAWAVQGQTPARPPARPDPLDALATVPPPAYASTFNRYRRWRDEPLQPWRASNDTAYAIGGWRAYAREAQQDPSGKPAPAPAHPANHQP